jgi:hypothetical protein
LTGRRASSAGAGRLPPASTKGGRPCFPELGLDASLEQIARAAGVATATAYRCFPDREELVDALLADGLAESIELARQALTAEDRGKDSSPSSSETWRSKKPTAACGPW